MFQRPLALILFHFPEPSSSHESPVSGTRAGAVGGGAKLASPDSRSGMEGPSDTGP